ncbi:MAG: hypothetical protein HOQ02_01150 [Lysobacter sp.]|nr:hypothetical protein [Lysobacter sp.]
MTKPDLRAYHRALALYCLGRSTRPATAADIAEHMGSLAQSEGHPRQYWIDITPASVAGHLRTLEREGSAARAEERNNPRHGRGEPTWSLSDAALGNEPRLPEPGDFEGQQPEPEVAPAAAAMQADRYEGMSRDQLLVVLRFNDDVAGATGRFMQEMRDIIERGRRTLIAAGVELP